MLPFLTDWKEVSAGSVAIATFFQTRNSFVDGRSSRTIDILSGAWVVFVVSCCVSLYEPHPEFGEDDKGDIW